MKKVISIFFLLLALIVLLPAFISAVEINFTKDSNSFASGETLIAKVSGNFVQDPTENNVAFYRGNERVGISYEIAEMNEDFYIYAQLPIATPGNYSLVLEDVAYFIGLEESDADLTTNFIITNQTADFTTTPGFVDSSNTSAFEINVQNLKPSQITVSIDADGFSNPSSIIVKSGEIKTISFTRENPDDISTIELSTSNTKYLIPVFSSNETVSGESINGQEERSMRFEPDSISVSVPTGSESKRIVYLLNDGSEDIEDIEFLVPIELKDYITIVSSSDVGSNETEKVQMIIASSDKEMSLTGRIIAQSENVSASLRITVNFIDDYVPVAGSPDSNSNSEEVVILSSCSGLGGKFCSATEKCSEDIVAVGDGNGLCCLKTCEVKEKSSSGKILGWFLLLLVLGLLFWFFKRYKRVRPSVDLLNVKKK